MNIYSPTISGSLTISGSIITTGGGLPLTGSLVSSGSFTSIGNTVVSGSLIITGSSTSTSTLEINGIQTNTAGNAVPAPRGTIRLLHDGAANTGDYGPSIVFAQRYFSTDPAPIGMGQISSVKLTPNGNFGGGLAFFTPTGTGNTFSERMRIDHSGSVGIGVTFPSESLHVNGTINADGTDAAFVYRSRNTSATGAPIQLSIQHNSGNVAINNARGSIYFTPNIGFTSGSVGIGKTSANTRLDVNGNALISGSLTVTGSIIAQTLVVQTVTASVDFITGSTITGTLSSNTHQFTGSVLVSGSISSTSTITGSAILVNPTGPAFITVGPTTSYGYIGSGGAGATLYLNGSARGGSLTAASNAMVLATDGDIYLTNALSNSYKMVVTSIGSIGIGTSTITEGTQATSTISIFPSSSVSNGPLIQFSSNGRIRPAGITERLSIDGNALFLNSTFGGNIIMVTGGGNVGIGTASPTSNLMVYGGVNTATFVNTNSAANSNVQLGNNSITNGAGMALFGSTYTSNAQYRQSGAYFYSNQAGGLTVHAEGNNNIFLATNNTLRLNIDGAGDIFLSNTLTPLNLKPENTFSTAITSLSSASSTYNQKPGVYWLNYGGQTFLGYVRFNWHQGRNWVLALKCHNTHDMPAGSALWQNNTLINQSDFNLHSGRMAKYPAWNHFAFTRLLYEMGNRIPPIMQWNTQRTSLFSVFSGITVSNGSGVGPDSTDPQISTTVTTAFSDMANYVGSNFPVFSGGQESNISFYGLGSFANNSTNSTSAANTGLTNGFGLTTEHLGAYSSLQSTGRSGAWIGCPLDEGTHVFNAPSSAGADSGFGLGVAGGNSARTATSGIISWATGNSVMNFLPAYVWLSID